MERGSSMSTTGSSTEEIATAGSSTEETATEGSSNQESKTRKRTTETLKKDIKNLESKFTRFTAFSIHEIYQMGEKDRSKFLQEFCTFCDEVENHYKYLTSIHTEFLDKPLSNKNKRAKFSAKDMGYGETPLSGDLKPLNEIQLLSVYELMKSNKGSGYKYVSSGGNGAFHAQPYVKGVRDNGRWNAGYYETSYLAACAVSIASAHLCHKPRVLEIMEMLEPQQYNVIS